MHTSNARIPKYFFFSRYTYFWFSWIRLFSLIRFQPSFQRCRWVLLWCIYSFDRSNRSEWGHWGIFNRLIPFYLSLSLFKRLFNCLKFTNMHSTFPPMYRPSRMFLLFKRSKDLKMFQRLSRSLYHSKNQLYIFFVFPQQQQKSVREKVWYEQQNITLCHFHITIGLGKHPTIIFPFESLF